MANYFLKFPYIYIFIHTISICLPVHPPNNSWLHGVLSVLIRGGGSPLFIYCRLERSTFVCRLRTWWGSDHCRLCKTVACAVFEQTHYGFGTSYFKDRSGVLGVSWCLLGAPEAPLCASWGRLGIYLSTPILIYVYIYIYIYYHSNL